MMYDPVASAILRHNIAEDMEYREYLERINGGYNEECDNCYVNCNNCSFCSNLKNCNNCRGCSDMQNCDNCKDSDYGHDNYACEFCINCNNCIECIDCTNCESCMACLDCESLKNSHHCYKTYGGVNDEPMSFMWEGIRLSATEWLKKYDQIKGEKNV